jgi:transposase
MEQVIKARLKWVTLYEERGDAGYVCRRCGISRPTLRKWYKRYQELGIEGLNDQSRRPIHSPNKKVNQQIEEWILDVVKQIRIPQLSSMF